VDHGQLVRSLYKKATHPEPRRHVPPASPATTATTRRDKDLLLIRTGTGTTSRPRFTSPACRRKRGTGIATTRELQPTLMHVGDEDDRGAGQMVRPQRQASTD